MADVQDQKHKMKKAPVVDFERGPSAIHISLYYDPWVNGAGMPVRAPEEGQSPGDAARLAYNIPRCL